MGLSCKCTPKGESAPHRRGEVTFFGPEEGAAFNSGGINKVQRMTTEKVVSISGNDRVLYGTPAKILATPMDRSTVTANPACITLTLSHSLCVYRSGARRDYRSRTLTGNLLQMTFAVRNTHAPAVRHIVLASVVVRQSRPPSKSRRWQLIANIALRTATSCASPSSLMCVAKSGMDRLTDFELA